MRTSKPSIPAMEKQHLLSSSPALSEFPPHPDEEGEPGLGGFGLLARRFALSAAALVVGSMAVSALSKSPSVKFSSNTAETSAFSETDSPGASYDNVAAEMASRLQSDRLRRGIELSDEYSRKYGRQISDGLLSDSMPFLAQAHKPTKITPRDPGQYTWKINGELWEGAPDEKDGSIEITFEGVGRHRVEIVELEEEYEVHTKRVRRELRDLSKEDRQRYFDALLIIYTTNSADGKKVYGSHYESASWYVGEHIQGAADKSCDHWHDDAGIANHHIAYTWQFENTLVSVDHTLAAHYWDYTRDAAKYESIDSWQDINIFDDSWFGPVESKKDIPENYKGMHTVSEGTFAFLPIQRMDTGTSVTTNPYGLLRSPWNTNPTPYLMRHNSILGKLGDGYDTFPKCEKFSSFLNADSLGSMLSAIDGILHGPVHLMVGGHWGYPKDIVSFASSNPHRPEDGESTKVLIPADNFLLFSKLLWRQGYIRLPESCSADTPKDECVASCPEAIIGNRTAKEVLDVTGVTAIWDQIGGVNLTDDGLSSYNLKTDDILDAICRVGYAGELFTSAAPQDPLFWTMHGNVDRFLQLARMLKSLGYLSFSEDWGYEHKVIASDTAIVCDWSQVEPGSMQLPSCSKETCPGHREYDVLPFKNLIKEQSTLYTNLEMYEMIYPGYEKLPYVYDSLLYWEGCSSKTIYTGNLSSIPNVRS